MTFNSFHQHAINLQFFCFSGWIRVDLLILSLLRKYSYTGTSGHLPQTCNLTA